mmetsp:Transcript_27507/g.86040  ORF Transcript_27507/g.86040 Transcript_27507/m.86040 type:complete len:107 (-) Transcript_27507:449-769(-)
MRTATSVTEVWHGDDREGNHTTHARLSDGGTLPFGAMVWSAGLAPVRFVERLDALPKQDGSQRSSPTAACEYPAREGASSRSAIARVWRGRSCRPRPAWRNSRRPT